MNRQADRAGPTNLDSRKVLALAAAVAVLAGCTQPPDQQRLNRSREGADATQPFPTLNAALADGDVSLTSIRGNGNSSGIALAASLVNTTEATLRLRTRLVPALYLRTARQSAQNMLATGVYGAEGSYLIVDQVSVIEVPPGTITPVVLNAYCVDFEKDNPTAADSFTLGETPSWLAPLASGVARYEEEQSGNNNETAIVRAQIALWLAQGEDPDAIRARMNVSVSDLAAAASLDFVKR